MLVQITQQVRNFVINNFLFGKDNGLKDTDLLFEQGIIDSTGMLELLAFLEATFDFKVEDNEVVLENLKSVSQVSGFVMRKLNNGD